ncbi:unnamed protein product [Parnassius mnemosyne]|uniref:Uncharacterized protein n=1 Tax=Parnassius mnemosyne TaxID=213953 RepID=A0AAV1LU30_9NEOP
MASVNNFKDNIELCLIPKLNKNFDDCENHIEFKSRNLKLDEHFQIVLKKIEEINLKDLGLESEYILSHLLILYYELLSNGPWNSEHCLKLSQMLNSYFELLYGISLTNIFVYNEIFNYQAIFDKCVESLHSKLTSSDFKKYPGQIEVYNNIIKNLKLYDVAVVPSKVLPASLLLINDYIIDNKVKGLQCCISVLQCLNGRDFQEGNYYDVIYNSLKKVISEKDIEVTKLVFKCFKALYDVLPEDVKPTKVEDMYVNVLEQLYVESNLYRKAECINFIRILITIQKIHCASRSVFLAIIGDNLDLCCNETVADVLLHNILQTLKEWVKYCWCIWKLSAGQNILSNLFKVLYTCKDNDLATEIQSMIIILIRLCNDEDRKNITNELDLISCTMDNVFLNRISTIKKYIL